MIIKIKIAIVTELKFEPRRYMYAEFIIPTMHIKYHSNNASSLFVPAAGHWFRQHNPGRVHRLKNTLTMHAPRDLPNQDRRHPLQSQLLVYA